MRLRRLQSHSTFPLEGASEHFQSCWELELQTNEETSPRRNFDHEELILVIAGQALVRIDAAEHELSQGEVIMVPPQLSRRISNPGHDVLRVLTVESRAELPEDFQLEAPAPPPPIDDSPRDLLALLHQSTRELPTQLDESEAIAHLIEVFNLGSRHSEELEKTTTGASQEVAMAALERAVMNAVLAVAKRYQG